MIVYVNECMNAHVREIMCVSYVSELLERHHENRLYFITCNC